MITTQASVPIQPAHARPATRRSLRRDASVLAVQLSGSPGSGKTTLLEVTIQHLKGRARVAVIVAHPAAERDSNYLRPWASVVAMETRHADPDRVREILRQLDLHDLHIVFIETPEEDPLDLGEGVRVALFSVTGGDDKAAESPQRVVGADLVLLGKTDLLSLVKFDTRVFRADLIRLNPDARLLELSARDGSGMEQWIRWLLDRSQKLHSHSLSDPSMPEWWFG